MREERIKGTLIGKAVGDALGFPVEGNRPQECREYINARVKNPEIPPVGQFQAGQFTDDTQLAIALLETLIENEDFDPKAYLYKVGRLFSTNTVVGRGIATDQAIQRYLDDKPIEEVATPAPSAGNGTAMRAAVVGIYYHDDLDKVIHIAKLQSKVTHLDDRATAGSIIMAVAIHYLINFTDEEIDEKQFLEYCRDIIHPISPIFAKTIMQLVPVLDLPQDSARRLISTWGEPDFIDGWKYISPYVIPSVCWSLYSFLRYPNDYTKAVHTAILAGGDVDTTAAMTGALSGAFLGLSKIPSIWKKQVNDHGKWDIDQMIMLLERVN